MIPRRHCFGYGSLANQGTHDWPDAGTATLSGWRRAWSHRATGERFVTALTIEPAPGSVIEGRLLALPDTDWPKLDARESGYECVAAPVHPMLPDTVTYVSGNHVPADEVHPIWLSYVDTVLEGFFALGGIVSVEAFITTTDGWDAPIVDDRIDKRYPRATTLSRDTEREIDGLLADLPLIWVTAPD